MIGLYFVFCFNNIVYLDIVWEGKEDFDGIIIKVYIILYDEECWD